MTDTIAVIDADDARLASFCKWLKKRKHHVKSFMGASDFLEEVDKGAPLACLVCNIQLAEMSGLKLLQILKGQEYRIPVIFVTERAHISMAVSAVKCGAAAFVEKPYSLGRLMEAVSLAIETAKWRIAATGKERLASSVSRLSERQRQVMDLVAQGLTNKEISNVLKISEWTTAKYRAWAMQKIGARSAADLAQFRKVLNST